MADEIVVRGNELAAVSTFLDRGAGGLAALVVEGEAGMGKSTVWEAGVDAAASRGVFVRASRPAHAEQGLTLAGLTDLFGDVADQTLAQLPGPQRQALGVALLRIEPGARSSDQRTLSVAVAGLLRRLAADSSGSDRDRRRPVARREHRVDPRLRAPTTSDQPIGVLATVRTGAESPASDGPRAALPRTGWNGSLLGRCTSGACIGCSSSASVGCRSPASCWCEWRRRRRQPALCPRDGPRALTRTRRRSTAGRCCRCRKQHGLADRSPGGQAPGADP